MRQQAVATDVPPPPPVAFGFGSAAVAFCAATAESDLADALGEELRRIPRPSTPIVSAAPGVGPATHSEGVNAHELHNIHLGVRHDKKDPLLPLFNGDLSIHVEVLQKPLPRYKLVVDFEDTATVIKDVFPPLPSGKRTHRKVIAATTTTTTHTRTASPTTDEKTEKTHTQTLWTIAASRAPGYARVHGSPAMVRFTFTTTRTEEVASRIARLLYLGPGTRVTVNVSTDDDRRRWAIAIMDHSPLDADER